MAAVVPFHLCRCPTRRWVLALGIMAIGSWNNTTLALSLVNGHHHHPTIPQPSSTQSHHHQNGDVLLILGLGRVGREVARWAQPHFTSVIGTVRLEPSLQPTSDATRTTTTTLTPPNDDLVKDNNHNNNNLCMVPFDLSHIQPYLSKTSHVLITIPPLPNPDDQRELDQIYQTVLDSLDCRNGGGWVGIVSTAGVYGDHQGAWVTEESDDGDDDLTTMLRPTDDTAKRYLAYEEQWKQRISLLQHQLSQNGNGGGDPNPPTTTLLRIFRCAGIYGPQQSALHTAWRQQQQQQPTPTLTAVTRSIRATPTSPTLLSSSSTTPADLINRIHITDLARAVVASMLLGTQSTPQQHVVRVYNLADDLPESRRVVLNYATELLHSKGLRYVATNDNKKDDNEPQQQQQGDFDQSTSDATTTITPSVPTRSRRRLDCKRVSNQRMKQELLPLLLVQEGGGSSSSSSLLYPTYREGLDHILLEPTASWWNQQQ